MFLITVMTITAANISLQVAYSSHYSITYDVLAACKLK